MDKLQVLDRELRALGQYYRNDWSDFDGRCLKSELEGIMDWYKDVTLNSDFTEFSDSLKEQEDDE